MILMDNNNTLSKNTRSRKHLVSSLGSSNDFTNEINKESIEKNLPPKKRSLSEVSNNEKILENETIITETIISQSSDNKMTIFEFDLLDEKVSELKNKRVRLEIENPTSNISYDPKKIIISKYCSDKLKYIKSIEKKNEVEYLEFNFEFFQKAIIYEPNVYNHFVNLKTIKVEGLNDMMQFNNIIKCIPNIETIIFTKCALGELFFGNICLKRTIKEIILQQCREITEHRIISNFVFNSINIKLEQNIGIRNSFNYNDIKNQIRAKAIIPLSNEINRLKIKKEQIPPNIRDRISIILSNRILSKIKFDKDQYFVSIEE